MKVLFLDVDGVLNSVRSATALNGYPHPNMDEEASELIKGEERFDLVAVGLVRRVCKETDTEIVLSSTWRYSYKTKEALEEFGKRLNLPIIDRTPVTLSGNVRGYEIDKWINEHPEVTKYAIVDDDSDMLEEQEEFFVQTDPTNGLSYNDYLLLKDILEDKDVEK